MCSTYIEPCETLTCHDCPRSKEATDVRDTAVMVKEALEEAERAQNAASEAIKQAKTDIKGTQHLLAAVSQSGLERKVKGVNGNGGLCYSFVL